MKKQVAQGQYVVSDTRCPALHDCKFEWEEAGQRPKRGQSPVQHRGTFARPAWKCWWGAKISWLKAFKSLKAFPRLIWGLRGQISGLRGPGGDRRTDRQTNKSPPVSYRTLSLSGPLPCLSFQFTIMQSRATGIADHVLPLGDLFFFRTKIFVRERFQLPFSE